MLDLVKAAVNDPQVAPGMVFALFAVIGQLFHMVRKWSTGEAETLFGWMTSNPRRSVAAILTNFTAVLGAVGIAGVANMTPLQLIGAGFFLGLGIDSTVNKGAPVEPK